MQHKTELEVRLISYLFQSFISRTRMYGKAEDVLKIAQEVRLSRVYFNLLYPVHGCTAKLKMC